MTEDGQDGDGVEDDRDGGAGAVGRFLSWFK